MGKERIITFRCPQPLLEAMDKLALNLGCNRNAIVVAACKLFSRQVKERGGYIYPTGDEFPLPEKAPRAKRGSKKETNA